MFTLRESGVDQERGSVSLKELLRSLAKTIGEFDGLVLMEPDPGNPVASLGEVEGSYAGLACPDCIAETARDDFQWLMFLAGMASDERPPDDKS